MLQFLADLSNLHKYQAQEYTRLLKMQEALEPVYVYQEDSLLSVNIERLTVTLPKYDAMLLSYFRGDLPADDLLVGLCGEDTLQRLAIRIIYFGCTVSVECFRQLTLFCKKTKLPCGPEKDLGMVNKMYNTDKSLPLSLEMTPNLRLARVLCEEVLGTYPTPDVFDSLTPGSGSSADRVETPHRWNLEHFKQTVPLKNWFGELTPHVSTSHKDLVSRVILVPKDARGPRVIACEPNFMLMHQKSVQLWLHDRFNNHELARGRVNVLDQRINQELAFKGSVTGALATLDMEEASDRVSLALVRALVPPAWYNLLKELRCKRFSIDEKTFPSLAKRTVTTMRKFAPMGSALCFPIETLCFWAIAASGVARSRGISIQKAARLVTVHGDDTILPSDCFDSAVDALHAVSLKVNVAKSFPQGPFRESCGGDYYNGHDVAPIRCNETWSTDREREINLRRLRNAFYSKGLWYVAAQLDSQLNMPFTVSTSTPQGELRETLIPTFVGGYVVGLSKLMYPQVPGYVTSTKKHRVRPTDVGRWLQYWLTIDNSDFEPHLARTFSFIREWEGAYTTDYRYKRAKKGAIGKRIVTKRTSTYDRRGGESLEGRVPIDYAFSSTSMLVLQQLKQQGFFATLKAPRLGKAA
jgi:hypothetical protein